MTANESQLRPAGRPAISIVIPVFNVEPYLRECLDSVVNQTLPAIEMVCVDDASTDGSPAILGEYAAKDARIRVITYAENRSLSQARKDGVLAAAGDYILFLDSDDYLERNACEVLLGKMREAQVDILHFGTHVINADAAQETRVETLREFLRPCPERLEGREVFEGFFREGRFRHTLWNKLYTAELCRKAFARVEDGSFPKGQDLYAFVLLAYFARSYAGFPGLDLVYYRFGSGITGRSWMGLGHFERFCRQARVPGAIRRFFEAEGVLEAYRGDYDRMHGQLLNDCLYNWRTTLLPEDRPQGFDRLVEAWGGVETISGLARGAWNQRGRLARELVGAQALACRKTAFRTVGTYYQKIANGGVQRVLCSLIALWKGMGLEVVLFTDEPPSPDDYPLPDGVKRVVLPPREESEEGRYGERARQLSAALAEHGVEVMVYHAWAAKTLLWDMLVVKSLGIPFVVNTHSVFSFIFLSTNPYMAELAAIYGLCDAVVSLSRVDQRFWSHFVPRAFYLPNPLTFDVDKVSGSKLERPEVLWVGRFSREKRPLDAIRIMGQVVRAVPEARLRLLGSGTDEELNKRIQQEIEESGLQGHVELCGYHPDVGPFYEAASVYLATSRYEGFPMGLVESKSHGLPCVMYELPFTEMGRDGEGVVAVEHRNIRKAAEAVIALLQDGAYRARMGAAARRSLETYAAFDLAAGWGGVLDAVGGGGGPVTPGAAVDETARIMMETLIAHYRQGRNQLSVLERRLDKVKEALGEARKTREEALRELRQVCKALAEGQQREVVLRESWAYRLGRAMLYVPGLLLGAARKAKGGERR